MRTKITAMLLAVCCLGCAANRPVSPGIDVDPFIGTGGHGHTFPGATLPFGMVQPGPDTRLSGWDGCSAFHYSDDVLYGFSHTHLSGTGCSDYGDILFMPVTGEPPLRQGDGTPANRGYESRFDPRTQEATPGYYRVGLADYGITAELTATRRCACHRYRCPPGADVGMVVDLAHRDETIEAWIEFVSDTEIVGYRRSKAWAADQRVFFVARFSSPIVSRYVLADGARWDGALEARGTDVRAYLAFDPEPVFGSPRGRGGRRKAATPPTVMPVRWLNVSVGLSATSVAGARRNLDAEIGGRSFESVRADAAAAWEAALSKIVVEGGSAADRRNFYTALYHAMIAPNLYMDVDGRYRGRDLEIHEATDFDYYTVFSLWDTFRATHPLLAIIEPERTVDFVKTFLAQHEQGGALPVWELSANETDCMIGYHAVSVIADAWAKGIRGFDGEAALDAMVSMAERDWRGIRAYMEHGYVPAEVEGESASKTLEYAYDDWCISRMAAALGRDGVAARFGRRARSWMNLYDPGTRFMRARLDGAWREPFDPAAVTFDYTEANAWQYRFFVPHDVSGLIEALGGDDAFVAALDSLFEAPAALTGRSQADITGLIGQYAHGNEPSHHVAWLYTYAGRPWKTQAMTRRIMRELYRPRPDGLCGNEDCGQLSAWFVLAALGIYPVTPGSDCWVLGSPLFDRASIDVGGGRRFTVRAEGNGPENVYVQSARLNGEPLTRSFLRHDEIVAGGELVFVMGPEPNVRWGAAPPDRPRAAVAGVPPTPVPFVAAGEPVFVDSTTVRLGVAADDATIRFETGGGEPGPGSPTADGLIVLRESTVISAVARAPGQKESLPLRARFRRIPAGRSITHGTGWSDQYPAGGELALIDGLRGGRNFRTGGWQGYHGVGIDATVDLGAARSLDAVSTGFLRDVGAWIFLPARVTVLVSLDGKKFSRAGTVVRDEPATAGEPAIREFRVDVDGLQARWVRVVADNVGFCPPGHPGEGHKAWLFADEITIETADD